MLLELLDLGLKLCVARLALSKSSFKLGDAVLPVHGRIENELLKIVDRSNFSSLLNPRDDPASLGPERIRLRRAEVARLSLSDYDETEGSLRIEGKGNKERKAYLPEGTQNALSRWLAQRGSAPGPLLTHVNKAGAVRLKWVSPQLIYRVVGKRLLAAGIDSLTPHDMRRSFISDLLDEGVDLATVARQVGHSNVQTTARYDRRQERALRDAAACLDVPIDGL